MDDALIVIFIAEIDPNDVLQISSEVKKQFQEYLGNHLYWILGQLFIIYERIIADTGLIDIISPPAEFYPDIASLEKTVWEPLARFSWRPKQALDLSFLMMYAQNKGIFYVQLEDGVLTGKVGPWYSMF